MFQPRPGQPRHLGLRDESLERSNNLPDPDVLAEEIVEDLEAALEQFREIVAQEMVARVLELAKIRNGDVLGKNRVRDRHGLKP